MVVAWSEAESGAARRDRGAGARQRRRRRAPARTAPRCWTREPHLAPAALGGLLVPGEHVIDPWSAPLGLSAAGGGERCRGPVRRRGAGRRLRWHGLGAATPARGPVVGPDGRQLRRPVRRYRRAAPAGRRRVRDPAAQGPVRRVRQGGRARCCAPSSCRCRASAPRASSWPGRSSAICWWGRRPRSRRIASARPSSTATLRALIASAVDMVPALAGDAGDGDLCRAAAGDASARSTASATCPSGNG